MDVGYADNAGAIICHLIGDEKLFGFARCVKSSLKSAYFWCVDFRDPTAFSRIITQVGLEHNNPRTAAP